MARVPIAWTVEAAILLWWPFLAITSLVRILALALLFHDRAIIAVLRLVLVLVLVVRGIDLRWRLVHSIDFVDRAILAARVGAVGPGSGAIGTIGVDSVVRLVVAMLRLLVRSLLVVKLRVGCHAVAVARLLWSAILAAVVSALLLSVAAGTWAIVVAFGRNVGAHSVLAFVGVWVLTTKVAAPPASEVVVLIVLVRLWTLSVSVALKCNIVPLTRLERRPSLVAFVDGLLEGSDGV